MEHYAIKREGSCPNALYEFCIGDEECDQVQKDNEQRNNSVTHLIIYQHTNIVSAEVPPGDDPQGSKNFLGVK